MLTPETAADVWECYREIRVSEKLLADMEETKKENDREGHEPRLKDAFGRERQLQLGVPSGENGHRIFGLSHKLAVSVIKAHIANKRAELVSANERARIECLAESAI